MGAKLHAVSTSTGFCQTADHQRMVRKLAGALTIALNIRPGASLVMFLGSGHERNNLEAVCTWVNATLAAEGLPASRQALNTLTQMLEQELLSQLN